MKEITYGNNEKGKDREVNGRSSNSPALLAWHAGGKAVAKQDMEGTFQQAVRD